MAAAVTLWCEEREVVVLQGLEPCRWLVSALPTAFPGLDATRPQPASLRRETQLLASYGGV